MNDRNMTHELKTWPQYFQAVKKGTKTFEIRKNDRDFQIDDQLLLQEWDPIEQRYTGEHLTKVVTYILRDYPAVQDDHVVMGII